ncbi:MAG: AbrB/MazE/SpoVT family DNA-binding domain-containing protein [Verrucomicrobiales bacterium]|nr:AbrB/MazE/SpoVT family DNA-binding domain-containing protein [Verrucomicrobiales bacterium]
MTFATKGQVVIPSAVRRRFEIKEGTRATLTVTGQGIMLKPITAATIGAARGTLSGKNRGKSLAREWREHKQAEAKLED